MAETTYTYLLSQFPNNKVDTSSLSLQILENKIPIAAYQIVSHNNNCMITFLDELTSDQLLLLDTIISNHTGEAIYIENPIDTSNKLWVHESSRPLGTKTYFTGAGDDVSNPNDMGNGQCLCFDHKIGEPLIQSYYCDFNCLNQITHIHEGYLIWSNCSFDKISLYLVPKVIEVTTSTNTNYNLYNGYMIMPAAPGTGTCQIISDITLPNGGLLNVPANEHGERQPSFWNADFSASTGRFENITPAYNGDGCYNMFSQEVILAKFANRIPLLNTGFQLMQTADTEPIGQNMRVKIICETTGSDHDWQSALMITMHRSRIS